MSRLKLQWFNLEQKEGQDLCLKIPVYEVYAPIVDRAFPAVEHIGWRPSTRGTGFTYIKRITDEDRRALRDFLTLLGEIQCLTITDHLAPHFGGELDEAYALDFNFQPDVFPMAYTEVGHLEKAAKEQEDGDAAARLIERLATVIGRHPSLSRAQLLVPVPPRPSKTFHLPVELAKGIGAALSLPVTLKVAKAEHAKLKSLPMSEKVAALSGAFSIRGVIPGVVRKKSVIIIDDLFQSGATAWSLAAFLKSKGATSVYALTCVKSWRDTDNQ